VNSPTGLTHIPSTLQAYLGDLAHLAAGIPAATVRRTLAIGEVANARSLAAPRPSWLSVFTKALAFVGGAHPELRQVYMPWPLPYVYEHPFAVAAVALEREFDEEMPAMWARVSRPAQSGLQQLHSKLRRFKEDDPEKLGQLRRIEARSRWPWPLRRLAWAREAHWNGFRHARRLGTFAVASLGGLGVDWVDPVYPATTVLTFGTIQDASMEVCLKFDTRVLTAFTAARILQDLERVLRCEIVMELRYFEQLEAA
jgi:hypothetical protein